MKRANSRRSTSQLDTVVTNLRPMSHGTAESPGGSRRHEPWRDSDAIISYAASLLSRASSGISDGLAANYIVMDIRHLDLQGSEIACKWNAANMNDREIA